MPLLDLTKRAELGLGLTNAQGDANLTALELFINAILAGTAGYEAGNALKLGGVSPSEYSRAVKGNTVCADNVATALFTLPAGFYALYCGYAPNANIAATAHAVSDGINIKINAINASSAILSASGANVKMTQSTGNPTLPMSWSYLKMG